VQMGEQVGHPGVAGQHTRQGGEPDGVNHGHEILPPVPRPARGG
jgi:hypothetical protein